MLSECLRVDTLSLALTVACLLAARAGLAQPAEADDFIVPDREAFLRLLDLSKPELAPVKAAL